MGSRAISQVSRRGSYSTNAKIPFMRFSQSLGELVVQVEDHLAVGEGLEVMGLAQPARRALWL